MIPHSAPPDQVERLRDSVSRPESEHQYPRLSGQRAGYVYVIRLKVKRAFKIGRAVDPTDRLSDFVVDMPLDLELVSAFRADDYHQAESKLHRMCDGREWHLTGEWYELPPWAVRTISRVSKYEAGVFYRNADEVSEIHQLMPIAEDEHG